MEQYVSEDGEIIYYKVIRGTPHIRFRKSKQQKVNLGIAFRTVDAPIGYIPFYGVNDFDFSGETSFKEKVLAHLPLSPSNHASPHSLLIQYSMEDIDFSGPGGDRLSIVQEVKKDFINYTMRTAAGAFIDGIMLALGGPAVKTLVGQLIKSKIKQFIVSTAISAGAKKVLKKHYDVDK